MYVKNVINAFWGLTLRLMLMQSLELNFSCQNVAFVLDKNNITHLCTTFDRPQLDRISSADKCFQPNRYS